MAHLNPRKPLALTAVLAASVGAVLAGPATAGATSYGNAGSPVTITANGALNVVGGPKITLPAGAHDVSWSGQAGRFAFIGADNGIYTLDYSGENLVKVAQGTNPSHTVWDISSLKVYWTEGTGTAARIVGAAGSGAQDGVQELIRTAPRAWARATPTSPPTTTSRWCSRPLTPPGTPVSRWPGGPRRATRS
ncbi:hypothetical protein ACFQ9X_04565 [Catenulispora yoronensis]